MNFDPELMLGAVQARCPRGMRLQALAFRKQNWSPDEAARWAMSHGYPSAIHSEPEWNYHRIRVEDPSHFTDPWSWGKPWLPGLFPVYGCPLERHARAPARGTVSRGRKVRPKAAAPLRRRAVAGVEALGMTNMGFVSRLWTEKMNPMFFLPVIDPQAGAVLDYVTGHHTVEPRFSVMYFVEDILWGEREETRRGRTVTHVVSVTSRKDFLEFWEKIKRLAELNAVEAQDADKEMREKIKEA